MYNGDTNSVQRICMKIFLTDDVKGVGKAGEIVKVSDGFAINYLFPRKLAIAVTPSNQQELIKRRARLEENQVEARNQQSMLSKKIESLRPVLSSKADETGKLYGAVSPKVIVGLLLNQGVSINKSQVKFHKPIKKVGKHTLTIKLSSNFQPTCTLKVVAEEA